MEIKINKFLTAAITATLFIALAGLNADARSSKSKKRKTTVNTEVEKLKVTGVRDSYNVLPPQGNNTYFGKNMFDGDPSTGWAVKLSDGIIDSDTFYGPLININARKLSHIRIMNGYGKSEDSFENNTRAAWITIYRDDYMDGVYPDECDIIYNGPLEDTMEYQTLQLNPEFNNSRPTKRVGVIIPSYYADEENGGGGYYMGNVWDDLVISELEFYGIPK